eukprot:GHVR01106217.1.p1 GENE.GHVR01106217.1~~GHVR01106217.1.p1  ORF type:complete len:139 (-),score=23.45 GHVR01106217.1:356-772(-)
MPDERLLVLGATNRPQDLDDAAIRRFPKRFYVPLPCVDTRLILINKTLMETRHTLSDNDLQYIARATNNCSSSDITALCCEASMGPLRCIENIQTLKPVDVPPVTLNHFKAALGVVRPSASTAAIVEIEKWSDKFGAR